MRKWVKFKGWYSWQLKAQEEPLPSSSSPHPTIPNELLLLNSNPMDENTADPAKNTFTMRSLYTVKFKRRNILSHSQTV